MNIQYILKQNPFLFCRSLFGTNWRADIAAILLIRDVNPTEISKLLGCSYETAHRNYHSLIAVGWPKELKVWGADQILTRAGTEK